MNRYSKLFFVLLIASSLFSCDLDRFPPNAIALDQSLQSMSDAKNWDNGVFAFFRGRQYGIFTVAQDIQVDKLNATRAFGGRNIALHTWTGLSASDVTISNIWQEYYRALMNVNHLINSYPHLIASGAYVVNMPGDTAEENAAATAANRALLDRFLGNAHFARAFYYNELALRWSVSYDPATADTELSVPIVTEFNPINRPARATLREVYQFILSDIAEAHRLLAHVPGAPGATRFNRDVVTALEARVRLYMQDWTGAFQAANSLITSGRYPLETTVAGLENLWVHDRSDEVIMQSHTTAAELPNASGLTTNNNIYLNFTVVTGHFSPDFIPSQWVVDKFDANDIRRAVYFSNADSILIEGATHPGIYRVTKFRGNPAIPNSHIGGGAVPAPQANAQAPKVFRIAEMYLIAAEAAFRLGNETNALTALNTLRQARGLNAVTASGDALFQEIKDERFRELAFEGFRLFDLRRWGLGFERREPQNPSVLTAGADFQFKRVEADNPRFVWGIPTNDIINNPNLVQNRGW